MTRTAESSDKRVRPDKEHALALLHQMLLVRRFEEKAAEVYQLGKIRGFLHLYIGEEAVATGAMSVIGPDDNVVTTYRDHGHALARGVPATALMAEMYGKSSGCSKGRGGSMHFFDVSRRFYGGYAIVGGGLPIAAGLALADRKLGQKRVTACFFGDGAVAEGEFHETMNLASLWQLPVLFLCENNLYAMGTPLDTTLADADIASKAKAYGIEATVVDGMKVLDVQDATIEAIEAVRNGGGPRLLELRTYRFRGHSMSDPELYRDKSEVEEWKERDPIALFQDYLFDMELASQEDIDRIETVVTREIEKAVQFAEESSVEALEDLTRDVYVRDPVGEA